MRLQANFVLGDLRGWAWGQVGSERDVQHALFWPRDENKLHSSGEDLQPRKKTFDDIFPLNKEKQKILQLSAIFFTSTIISSSEEEIINELKNYCKSYKYFVTLTQLLTYHRTTQMVLLSSDIWNLTFVTWYYNTM